MEDFEYKPTIPYNGYGTIPLQVEYIILSNSEIPREYPEEKTWREMNLEERIDLLKELFVEKRILNNKTIFELTGIYGEILTGLLNKMKEIDFIYSTGRGINRMHFIK